MEQVKVYYVDAELFMQKAEWQNYLQNLPFETQLKAKGFRCEIDQVRHLLGRMLLNEGAKQHYQLENASFQLQYTKNGKPFLPNAFHFNITHGGKYVMCAFSSERIGIDVEADIQKVPLEELSIFTPNEIQYLQAQKQKSQAFFQLWTAKEAILICEGCGLIDDLQKLEVNMTEQKGIFEKETYFLQT
ncbi:MAG: 4'-phosphopantetheinyl transferase family protein, partial [Bacteroidia bacterium]